MFYYIINWLPLMKDMLPAKRDLRIFLIGTGMYTMFHAYLFSKMGEKESLKQIRGIIYYIWLFDAVMMALVYRNYNKQKIEDRINKELKEKKHTVAPQVPNKDMLDAYNRILIQQKQMAIQNEKKNKKDQIKQSENTNNDENIQSPSIPMYNIKEKDPVASDNKNLSREDSEEIIKVDEIKLNEPIVTNQDHISVDESSSEDETENSAGVNIPMYNSSNMNA